MHVWIPEKRNHCRQQWQQGGCADLCVLLPDIFYSVGLSCLVAVLFTSSEIKLVVLLQCRVKLQAVLLVRFCFHVYLGHAHHATTTLRMPRCIFSIIHICTETRAERR